MWLKRENYETVNMDYVQSIQKRLNKDEDLYYIRFYQIHSNQCDYDFESEEERDEYYEALLNMIEAKEVSLLKL
jgi:hypothetical protein